MTTVYLFEVETYEREDVESFTKDECEKLYNKDNYSVQKFFGSVQDLINNEELDTENNWVRIFF